MRARCAILGIGPVLALAAAAPAMAVTTSQTFNTSGEHLFTVPAAVTSINVMLVGAHGAQNGTSVPGGLGGTVTATLAVTPGEQLYLEVGGDGGLVDISDTAGLGGYNGGGAGGRVQFIGFSGPSGAGGGGASDVRTCGATQPGCDTLGSRLVVAGGGGGAGGTANVDNAAGGQGGAADASGSSGQADGHGDAVGQPGARGTTTHGGAGGDQFATAGTLGIGGSGDDSFPGGAGGGGGGGIYGGGGGGMGVGQVVSVGPPAVEYGAGGGGGGGGASGVPANATGVSSFSLVPTVDGAEPEAMLTWTVPPPAVVTGAASLVQDTSATVNGTVNPDNAQLADCHFTVSPAPPAGSTISCAQQIGSGGTPQPVSAQLLGLKPSTTYSVTLAAASAAGSATGSAVTFTTLPPPPAITGLKVPARIKRHARHHAKIKLKLSEPASLKFTFARRRHGKFVPVAGSLTASATAGAVKLAFSGKLDGGKRLKPGRYQLSLVATSSIGESSAPIRATFRLV